MPHEIGPLVTDAHECFTVVKTFDGYAPDTGPLAHCATVALAEEFAAWCRTNDPHGNAPNEAVEEQYPDFSWSFSDGNEWCSGYEVRNGIARRHEIATTLEAILLCEVS